MDSIIYNKVETGKRIRKQRISLGLTQSDMACNINKNKKYYCDIECGNCGMSINTLLCIAASLHLSLDYLIVGTELNRFSKISDEVFQAICVLNFHTEQNRKKAIKFLLTFLTLIEDINK
jgi:transcriptional regulator with XRE-family HTH domain